MTKFKLIGSDGQRVFVRQLISECITEVNSKYGENNELSTHLINSIMNFIETKIYHSKYSKEKFDKKQILYLILKEVVEGKYDEEIQEVENAVRFIMDHKMIKIDPNFFLKIGTKVLKLVKDLII